MNSTNTSSTPLIQTSGLDFSFGKRRILKKLDIEVPEGSIYGFLGPNGAGKTTTIKCLTGLYPLGAGQIRIFGQDLHHHRINILSRTGNMVEDPSLYGHLSAFQNLSITRILRRLEKKRVEEVLQQVGLTTDAYRPVRQFSSGMKQRLVLAQAILAQPELLILDEPINGLDPGGIIEIRNLLRQLNQEEGVTIFISSHILSEIEKLCSHVAFIHKGELLYQGRMEDIPQGRQNTMKVRIETDNILKSKEILREYQVSESGQHELHFFPPDKETLGVIVSRLVESGVTVYQVVQEKNDLEHTFLELTQD